MSTLDEADSCAGTNWCSLLVKSKKSPSSSLSLCASLFPAVVMFSPKRLLAVGMAAGEVDRDVAGEPNSIEAPLDSFL